MIKVVKQIDQKTRIIQAGKTPDVMIILQRKKWWGWSRINWIGSARCNRIEDFERLLLEDEINRKQPYYGQIIHPEIF